MHTRQLQQFTKDNYNNTHKATTTIQARQLQQYKQDNYNNTHKETKTIQTRQLQQYTRKLQQYTQENNNTHKKTKTIHTRKLKQYRQDNYNNTLKKTTTIHSRKLQQYTRPTNNNRERTVLRTATYRLWCHQMLYNKIITSWWAHSARNMFFVSFLFYFPNLGKARELNFCRRSAFMLLVQNVVENL